MANLLDSFHAFGFWAHCETNAEFRIGNMDYEAALLHGGVFEVGGGSTMHVNDQFEMMPAFWEGGGSTQFFCIQTRGPSFFACVRYIPFAFVSFLSLFNKHSKMRNDQVLETRGVFLRRLCLDTCRTSAVRTNMGPWPCCRPYCSLESRREMQWFAVVEQPATGATPEMKARK